MMKHLILIIGLGLLPDMQVHAVDDAWLANEFGNYAPNAAFAMNTNLAWTALTNIDELTVTQDDALLYGRSMKMSGLTTPPGAPTYVYECGYTVTDLGEFVDKTVRFTVWFKCRTSGGLSQLKLGVNGTLNSDWIESVGDEWKHVSLEYACTESDASLNFKIIGLYDPIYIDCISITAEPDPEFIQHVTFPGGNFIRNWDFEEAAGWSFLQGGSGVQASDLDEIDRWLGSKSIQVPDAGHGIAVPLSSIFQDDIRRYQLLVDEKLLFSAWVNVPQAATLSIGFFKYATFPAQLGPEVVTNFAFKNPVDIDYDPTVHKPTGAWVRITSPWLVLADYTLTEWGICVKFEGLVPSSTTRSFRVDGAVLEANDTGAPAELDVVTEFLDRSGRTVQKLRRRPDGTDIVQTTVHTQNGLWQTFKSVRMANAGHGFITGVTGLVAAYYQGSDLTQYPFAEIERETSPLARTIKVFSPGAPATGNRTRPVTYVYGNCTHDGDTRKCITVTDANGIARKEVQDGYGNVICKTVASGTNISRTDFSYDVRGNVTKVLSPKYNEDPIANAAFVSEFLYNAYGQLERKEVPDMQDDLGADENDILLYPDVEYKYDTGGRLRFQQDPNQKRKGGVGLFECTELTYDVFGRKKEKALISGPSGSCSWTMLDPNGTSGLPDRVLLTAYHYDAAPDYTAYPWNTFMTLYGVAPPVLRSLKTRVAAVAYRAADDPADDTFGFEFYSYDAYGRLAEHHRALPGINRVFVTGYEYDPAGNIAAVHYDGVYSSFYAYDAQGRLSEVREGRDSGPLARYTYTDDGNISCIRYFNETGDVIQKIDYAYNHENNLNAINDINAIGSDPAMSFAEEISYNAAGLSADGASAQSYYGNVPARVEYKHVTADAAAPGTEHYRYTMGYDGSERLAQADFESAEYVSGAFSGWLGTGSGAYDTEDIVYDANGNVQSYARRTSGGVDMPDYEYYPNTNRLMNTEGLSDYQEYVYDANGNVITNLGLGWGSPDEQGITYNSDNLATSILMPGNTEDIVVTFTYDHAGNRIMKKVQRVSE